MNDLLDQVDNLFTDIAKRFKVKSCKNYHDIPSRSLFWWDHGLVKFIQLKSVSESLYEVWIGAYKLPLPVLNFWTIYLDVPNDFSRRMTELKQPVRQEDVRRWLEKSKADLAQVDRRSVVHGPTSSTIIGNMLIPENILSLVLAIGIVAVFIYLLFRKLLLS